MMCYGIKMKTVSLVVVNPLFRTMSFTLTASITAHLSGEKWVNGSPSKIHGMINIWS